MTFLIAAAGTGGHVFPGLSVGEALLDQGVPRDDVLYVGGDRLEAEVYPGEGFPFLQVELRGLQRSLTPKNLALPSIVLKARKRIQAAITERRVGVALGMGGYVTIPTGMAAKRSAVPLLISEQNAEAGLANRISSRWAARSFGSFPETIGMADAVWAGNPVRKPFWDYDRDALRARALNRYRLDADLPVLGVFGGSLGAGIINDVITETLSNWDGPPIQVVHITGKRNIESLAGIEAGEGVTWRRVAFEESMETFYAACDLLVARAGGAVAELTATATPAILVPGSFGSSGHQAGNAAFLTGAGAARTIEESELHRMSDVIKEVLFDRQGLEAMMAAARQIARPDAARTVALAMLELGT